MEQHSQFPPIAYGAVGYSKRNQSTTIQTTFRIKAFENFNAKTDMIQTFNSTDVISESTSEVVMQKTDISVQNLVSEVGRNLLRLPEMQRGYVWRATRVRDLLDSLYRGYPSGNILVWETDEETQVREMAVGQSSPSSGQFKLLLDGQQRLTSLSAVLRGEHVVVRGRSRPIDILFNLDHPDTLEEALEFDDDDDNDPDELDDDENNEELSVEERTRKFTFVVHSRRLAAMPNWVSVTEIMKTDSDAPFLKKAGVATFDDARYEKYTTRLQRVRGIRNYMYNVQVLDRSMSYEEVTEVFVRVNSLGAKLRSSDLALAQITARWKGSLKIFEEFGRECADESFPLLTGTLVKALVVHATGQNKFMTVHTLSLEDLQDGWVRAKRGLKWAINFFRNNVGIESPALMSSPFGLLAVAYAAEHFDFSPSQSDLVKLRFWTAVSNARGRYSRGSSETLLDQDLSMIRRNAGIDALIESLKQQFGRLHFDVEELDGRTHRSSFFRAMFIASRQRGAVDWKTGIAISVHNLGNEHKLQYHHIFPKATLKSSYNTQQIDDLANLAFISGKTNQSISAKPVSEYLPGVAKKLGIESLKSQSIPLDRQLWNIDQYDSFKSARRIELTEMVNSYLGTLTS